MAQFLSLADSLIAHRRPHMVLRICVQDSALRYHYEPAIIAHNEKMQRNIDFPDSGFDLLTPYCADSDVGSHKCVCNKVNKVNLGVKCAAVLYDAEGNATNTGYYLYPRSSISKSCIRLANSVGIIDAGYRGPMIAMVDVVYDNECYLNAYEKMFQICAPGLVPILVELVDELGEKTERGEGGFGSTTRGAKPP